MFPPPWGFVTNAKLEFDNCVFVAAGIKILLSVGIVGFTGFVDEDTVTVAVPDFDVSTVEVALTVNVAAVSLEATVSRPVEEMLVPDTPLTLHVTVCAGELAPLTVALN